MKYRGFEYKIGSFFHSGTGTDVFHPVVSGLFFSEAHDIKQEAIDAAKTRINEIHEQCGTDGAVKIIDALLYLDECGRDDAYGDDYDRLWNNTRKDALAFLAEHKGDK